MTGSRCANNLDVVEDALGESMARRLAAVIRHAPGFSGMPSSGQSSSAVTRASWASSSATPISWVTPAMAAMSRVDSIFHTASIAELGDGSGTNSAKPKAVAGGVRFRQVLPGGGYISDSGEQFPDDAYSCGVSTDDKIYCWGLAAFGSFEGPTTPIAGGRRRRYVNTGRGHLCGLTYAGAAFCWGYNYVGQLGDGTTTSSYMTQVPVSGGLTFSGLSVAPLGGHTCGLTTGRRAYCWGSNVSAQLGDGTRTNRLVRRRCSDRRDGGAGAVCAGHSPSWAVGQVRPLRRSLGRALRAPPLRRWRGLRVPERRDVRREGHSRDPVGVVIAHAVRRREVAALPPNDMQISCKRPKKTYVPYRR